MSIRGAIAILEFYHKAVKFFESCVFVANCSALHEFIVFRENTRSFRSERYRYKL